MLITCKQAPKTGTIISIFTDEGKEIDSFRAPTSNGFQYCVLHRTSKYTRRLQHGIDVAMRLDSQAPAAANDARGDGQERAA